jgi:protein TonB
MMEPPLRTFGTTPRHMSVFAATCLLHVLGIYLIGTMGARDSGPLWHALEVSFIPVEEPTEPPPPAIIPVVLTDAFAERPIDIPAPTTDLSTPQEAGDAIHAPPPEETTVAPDPAVEDGRGYGPLTKPRVIGGPKYPQDRYPRASIRNKESGRPIVKICISDEGKVVSAEVAQSSGYPRLDAAAVDMSLDYVFAPAMREGKAVPVCMAYGIDFRLAVSGSRRRSR